MHRDPQDPDELPNTKQWRQAVVAIVDDPSSEWDRSSLATAVGCKPTTMTKLLNGTTRASRFVRRINEKLDIVHLEPFIVDPLLKAIIDRILEVESDDDLDFIAAAVKRVKSNPP